MPISVEHYATPNQLLLKGRGAIDFAEMTQSIAVHRSGEQRRTPFILDLTEATLKLSADDVYMLAEKMAGEMKRSPIGPVAVIATADEVFGIGRMYQAYSDIAGRPQVGVFRDIAAAERWLATVK